MVRTATLALLACLVTACAAASKPISVPGIIEAAAFVSTNEARTAPLADGTDATITVPIPEKAATAAVPALNHIISGDQFTYSVTSKARQVYNLSYKLAASDPAGPLLVYVAVNKDCDSAQQATFASPAFATTTQFAFATYFGGQITLPVGLSTLTVCFAEAENLRFQSVVLIPAGVADGSGALHSVPGLLKAAVAAESALADNAAELFQTPAGAMFFPRSLKDLSFPITVPSAGQYDVSYKMSVSSPEPVSVAVALVINGQCDVDTQVAPFYTDSLDTIDWSPAESFSGGSITLTAGTHTLTACFGDMSLVAFEGVELTLLMPAATDTADSTLTATAPATAATAAATVAAAQTVQAQWKQDADSHVYPEVAKAPLKSEAPAKVKTVEVQQYQWPSARSGRKFAAAVAAAAAAAAADGGADGATAVQRGLMQTATYQQQQPTVILTAGSSSSTTLPPPPPAGAVWLYKPPAGGFDESVAATSFSAFVRAAMADSSVSGVKIASSGEGASYSVTPAAWSNFHLNVWCVAGESTTSGFFIDFSNVALIMTDHSKGALGVWGCTGVHMFGPAEISYAQEHLPYTQGAVSRVATDKLSLWFTVHAGYPTDMILDSDRGVLGAVYDSATRGLKRNASAIATAQAAITVSASVYKLTFDSALSGVAKGDLIAVRGSCPHCHGLLSYRNTDCLFSGLIFRNAPSYAVHDLDSTRSAYYSIQVLPGSQPVLPSGQRPLVSSGADGIHLTRSRGGAAVDTCKVVAALGDGIAVHGQYSAVPAAPVAGTLAVLITDPVRRPQKGDRMLVYSSALVPLGSVKVARVTTATSPFGKNKAAAPAEPAAIPVDLATAKYVRVHVTSWPAWMAKVGANSLVAFPSDSGDGFLLRRSDVRGVAGRGIAVKASNALVDSNRVSSAQRAAVSLAPELQLGEANYVKNVTVSNNVIADSGSGISLAYVSTAAQGYGAAQGHKNVTISSNTIRGINSPSILVSSSSGVTVKDNAVSAAWCSRSDVNSGASGGAAGPPAGTVIWAAQSSKGLYSNNTLDNSAGCKFAALDGPVVRFGDGVSSTIVKA